MTNQVVDKKVSRMPVYSKNDSIIARIVIAVILIATFIVAVNIANRNEVEANVSNPVAGVESQSFSTEMYWDMAREHAASGAQIASAVQDRRFSTDVYWDHAKAYAASVVSLDPEVRSFDSQVYYDMAAEHAANLVAPAPAHSGSAYFTEQYWNMAKPAAAPRRLRASAPRSTMTWLPSTPRTLWPQPRRTVAPPISPSSTGTWLSRPLATADAELQHPGLLRHGCRACRQR